MTTKSEQRFTPGPWHAHPVSTRHGLPYSPVVAKTLLARVYSEAYGDHEQSEANAHLIAAAPELYAAVENLIAAITPLHNAHFQIERECISDSDVEDAQAAVRDAELVLAKARGEHHEK